MCMCTHMQIFMPGHMWKSEVGCLGLSLNPALSILAKPARQRALGSTSLHKHLAPCAGVQRYTILSMFYVDARDPNSDLPEPK